MNSITLHIISFALFNILTFKFCIYLYHIYEHFRNETINTNSISFIALFVLNTCCYCRYLYLDKYTLIEYELCQLLISLTLTCIAVIDIQCYKIPNKLLLALLILGLSKAIIMQCHDIYKYIEFSNNHKYCGYGIYIKQLIEIILHRVTMSNITSPLLYMVNSLKLNIAIAILVCIIGLIIPNHCMGYGDIKLLSIIIILYGLSNVLYILVATTLLLIIYIIFIFIYNSLVNFKESAYFNKLMKTKIPLAPFLVLSSILVMYV